jgi:hypothetical protein
MYFQQKIGNANCKSANCHICRWYANLRIFFNTQICRFANLFADKTTFVPSDRREIIV